MIETIFALIAACVTIFIAGLLVDKQNKCSKTRKELDDQILYSLNDIANEVALLTSEPETEASLSYLELRMESLNKCLRNIPKSPKPRDRRMKHDKRKKNFANDWAAF